MNIIKYFKTLQRKHEAKCYGVPFRQRMWYNCRAMLPKDKLHEHQFIEIFDSDGSYINCPGIGGEVIFNDHGRRYRYRVVDFKNDSANADWLYDGDWINPIVEYVGKVKEEMNV